MLELIHSVQDPITYASCSTADYNLAVKWGGLCTLPVTYKESIYPVFNSFVYNHDEDVYTFTTTFTNVSIAAWRFAYYNFHPETGAVTASGNLTGVGLQAGRFYNGGLNSLYCHSNLGDLIKVSVRNGVVKFHDDIIIDTPTDIPLTAIVNCGLAVCPERKLITSMNVVDFIKVWDYSSLPATTVHRVGQPENYYWSVGYESTEVCWGLFSGSIFAAQASNDARQSLMKYNYYKNKVELLTELQTSAVPDRLAFVAFDPKRKKLAALRIKNDEANGAANNALEIYNPRPAITKVTVPVNLDPISDEGTIRFVSHVLGSKAEAGGSREVSISCAPTAALVTIPKQITTANGRVEVVLHPHTAGASEALTISYNETKVTS